MSDTTLLYQRLPYAWRNHLSAHLQPITVGMSGAQVWRSTTAVLKVMRRTFLQAEYDRYTWLMGRLPVPEVLGFHQDDHYDYLLTRVLDGVTSEDIGLSPAQQVTLAVQAVQHLHAVEITDCPFRADTATLVRQARQAYLTNTVSIHHFNPENEGRDVGDMLAELENTVPTPSQAVLVHGDLYPENYLIDKSTHRIIGFLDVGRLGVGDPYWDYALVYNALRDEGEEYAQAFFQQVGEHPVQADKLAWYLLLDEFF